MVQKPTACKHQGVLMASTIDVACPECQKQIKASAELQGKKVRCKGCGHVFVIGGATASKPSAEAKAGPVKVGPKASGDEDDAKAYGLSAITDEGIPRCPHCAQEMSSAEAIICLHCGYN